MDNIENFNILVDKLFKHKPKEQVAKLEKEEVIISSSFLKSKKGE